MSARLSYALPLSLSVFATTAFAQGDGGSVGATCAQAISDDSAQRLFAAIERFHGEDGCVLEEVRTESDVMRIEWRKGGAPVPLVEVRPTACAVGATVSGPAFAMSVPAVTTQECPAAVERMKSLVVSESFGGPVRLGDVAPSTRRRSLLAIFAGVGAAVLAVAAVLAWRRRRAKPSPPG
jgi:hypothetical protein